MPKPFPPAGPVDLDALDAFLLSDRAPEGSMGLSDLDGFLTAIAAGPGLVLPSEWMPVIWGGDVPAFESLDEARRVLGMITGHYNEITHLLDTAPEDFDPVFWEGRDGEVIVTDWAAGFLDAVALRPRAWEPLVQHPEARSLIIPLLLLGADDLDDMPFSGISLPAVDEEELLAAGPGLILGCVAGIKAFWKEHDAKRSAATRRNPPRRSTAQRRR